MYSFVSVKHISLRLSCYSSYYERRLKYISYKFIENGMKRAPPGLDTAEETAPTPVQVSRDSTISCTMHLPTVSLAVCSMKTSMTSWMTSSGSSEGRTSLYSYCNANVDIHRQSGKYSFITGQNDLLRSTARTRRSLAQLATTSSSAPPEANSSSLMLVIVG